jgi:hypothetical protein
LGEGSLDLFAPIALFALERSGKLASFRHGCESGLGGFGFRFGAEGLETVEVAGGLADGALEAVDHAADAVENGGFPLQGIDTGVPKFGFGIEEPIETPGVRGELVYELALDAVEGSPSGLEFRGEGFEFSGIFAGDDERLGVDAVFEGVQANGCSAFERGRPGGMLRISAIGFNLYES